MGCSIGPVQILLSFLLLHFYLRFSSSPPLRPSLPLPPSLHLPSFLLEVCSLLKGLSRFQSPHAPLDHPATSVSAEPSSTTGFWLALGLEVLGAVVRGFLIPSGHQTSSFSVLGYPGHAGPCGIILEDISMGVPGGLTLTPLLFISLPHCVLSLWLSSCSCLSFLVGYSKLIPGGSPWAVSLGWKAPH